ncbi:MAG: BMP family ABC transporter substrate-binding protein [Spirochaetales bacterium]|nr:BMP family ABC transporter substrate-binding protein [Spirochaetales bacterium]MCF7937766.1 BMP family ABC transporter substrate-binding protein [Spirochaetales bacterium]
MKKTLNILLTGFVILMLITLISCEKEKKADTKQENFDIAVFVPGVTEGSPTYKEMVEGVQRAAEEKEGVSVNVVEGGFNQAEWPESLTSLAASGEYDLIVSSNPSIPEICDELTENHPDQRFLLLDGYLEGNEAIHTLLYNQMEQGYLAGYFGGLITKGDLEHANPDLKVGMIVGQEYPMMNQVILPGFKLGLKTADSSIQLDFRVVGNWYDAGKAQELAKSMYESGVDIILTIAGGANQGVISSAKETGGYVIWYDTSGYDVAPGVVIGSTYIDQERAAYERSLAAIEGELVYGEAEILGVAEGFVGFDTEHNQYRRNVDEETRKNIDKMIERMKSGELQLEIPTIN